MLRGAFADLWVCRLGPCEIIISGTHVKELWNKYVDGTTWDLSLTDGFRMDLSASGEMSVNLNAGGARGYSSGFE